MAKIAFAVIVGLIPLSAVLYKMGWIDAAYITASAGVIIAVITALGAIISVYIGASAYDDVNNKED